MITKEVNDWMKKVEQGRYSYQTAMEEFERISRYLTKEEVKQVLSKLKNAL